MKIQYVKYLRCRRRSLGAMKLLMENIGVLHYPTLHLGNEMTPQQLLRDISCCNVVLINKYSVLCYRGSLLVVQDQCVYVYI